MTANELYHIGQYFRSIMRDLQLILFVVIMILISIGCEKETTMSFNEPVSFEKLGDGKLAFYRLGFGSSTFTGIVLLDIDQKKATTISPGGAAVIWEGSLALSNDGKSFAYSGFDISQLTYSIFTMDKTGSNVNKISNSIYHHFYPVWSTDNNKIFYLEKQYFGMQLYSIKKDGSDNQLFTDTIVTDRISVSPNGNEIAISTYFPNNTQGIGIMDCDDGNLLQFTTSDENTYHYSPSWSRSGDKIAYVNIHGPNQDTIQPYYFEIRVIEVNGKQDRVVKILPFEELMSMTYVTWSPDDNKLAFNFGTGSKNDYASHIFIINPDGTDLTQITSSVVFDGAPTWSE